MHVENADTQNLKRINHIILILNIFTFLIKFTILYKLHKIYVLNIFLNFSITYNLIRF